MELLVIRKKEFYENINDPSILSLQLLVQLPVIVRIFFEYYS